ncbi:MAG: periplasmic protein TonB [Sphingomonadales bacterium]|jgi:protein TonB|nr:periplasmic protein TonB [Sphingomonadales bacterium]
MERAGRRRYLWPMCKLTTNRTTPEEGTAPLKARIRMPFNAPAVLTWGPTLIRVVAASALIAAPAASIEAAPDQVPPAAPAAGAAPSGQAPVLIRGGIGDSDYPSELGAAGVGGAVGVRYTIGLDGRVTNCRIVEASPEPELNEFTCRLIVKRYRYRPAKDASGADMVADIVETHTWIPGPRPEERHHGR